MIPFALAAVILAAGRSSRMGQPKLLLPWGDTTVLGHLLATWNALGAAQIAVVCAPDNREIDTELDRLGFARDARISNPQPARGMFSSIQCAACWDRWDSGVTHWAIILGDQPHIQRRTLSTIVDFVRRHPKQICQPARRSQSESSSADLHGRHPPICPRTAFALLARSRHRTLRGFLSSMRAQIALLEMDDPGLDYDLDTPADYERLKRSR